MHGTYLGFIDCDNKRYWQYDGTFNPFKIQMVKDSIHSDHLKRIDLQELRVGNIKQAQINKEILEDSQRKDAKLRKQSKKK